jgi:hypothetical protein
MILVLIRVQGSIRLSMGHHHQEINLHPYKHKAYREQQIIIKEKTKLFTVPQKSKLIWLNKQL